MDIDNKPKALTHEEIREIAALEDIRQDWGANTEQEMAQLLDADICAVKFPYYLTDGPGYGGELFLLMGGALEAPLMLIRRNGHLKIVEDDYDYGCETVFS